jgi:hypothetical protein
MCEWSRCTGGTGYDNLALSRFTARLFAGIFIDDEVQKHYDWNAHHNGQKCNQDCEYWI